MLASDRSTISSFTLGATLVLAVGACGTAERMTWNAPASNAASTEPVDEPAPNFGSGPVDLTVDVTLRGTVYAPNGTLPLSNTLVYVTPTAPAAIPKGVYCDRCIKLPADTFTLSKADGTFEFAAKLQPGRNFLVVQKGQFRRVRSIYVKKGATITIDEENTTLPGAANLAKGDDVPRMAILKDSRDYDAIDESLEKLGITDWDLKTDRSMLEDAAELRQYQIVFVPCGSAGDPITIDPVAKANVQEFVKTGGKLYVTDYSYEFIRQPFPGYVTWDGEGEQLGSAIRSRWSAPATAEDKGLSQWLAATGDPTFDVSDNYTSIASVNSVATVDHDKHPVTVTPKVWISASVDGKSKPTTVSFANECGRVLFSTYHTEASSGGELLAQEKALLYVLLEVGVCVGDGLGVH